MADRYFLGSPIVDGKATLDDDQAAHLCKVMRAKPGDEVVLFDGQGNEFVCETETVSKKSVTLIVKSSQLVADLSPKISVAVALPKGDRQKFLVEKLVELGASKLIPCATRRGVAVANEGALNRLRKQVVEATKQCRRGRLMEVDTPRSIAQLIDAANDCEPDQIKLIADPYTDKDLANLEVGQAPTWIAIGPEGGFDEAELEQLEAAGWTKVRISQQVLRIETAAIAAIAILRASN